MTAVPSKPWLENVQLHPGTEWAVGPVQSLNVTGSLTDH